MSTVEKEDEEHGIEVTCRGCGRTWTYQGSNRYAQCGECRTSNSLEDQAAESIVILTETQFQDLTGGDSS